jgi:hypothetical protein
MLLSGGIGIVIAIQTQCTPAGVCLYTLALVWFLGAIISFPLPFNLIELTECFIKWLIDAPTLNYRIELLQVGFLRATCTRQSSSHVGLGDNFCRRPTEVSAPLWYDQGPKRLGEGAEDDKAIARGKQPARFFARLLDRWPGRFGLGGLHGPAAAFTGGCAARAG